jgi:hypothetical protein
MRAPVYEVTKFVASDYSIPNTNQCVKQMKQITVTPVSRMMLLENLLTNILLLFIIYLLIIKYIGSRYKRM